MKPPRAVLHYGLPKEAVANSLRLPRHASDCGSMHLHFTYFLDALRHVAIVLTDEPIPPSVTRTPAGLAVLSLTGTRIEIDAMSEDELRRIIGFLDRALKPYQL